MKLSDRILAHLQTNGPATLTTLTLAMGHTLPTVNNVITLLLQTGQIEWCEVGSQGGVRIKQ